MAVSSIERAAAQHRTNRTPITEQCLAACRELPADLEPLYKRIAPNVVWWDHTDRAIMEFMLRSKENWRIQKLSLRRAVMEEIRNRAKDLGIVTKP